jgi:hypothetical protein
MIAIVTAFIAAFVVTIFTAVELDRLKSKQQKADAGTDGIKGDLKISTRTNKTNT